MMTQNWWLMPETQDAGLRPLQQLSPQELVTIVTALRCFQEGYQELPAGIVGWTDIELLGDSEIEALVDKLSAAAAVSA